MAATNAADESSVAAAVHPLTEQDAASYAKRYFAKITQKAPKIDSYYTYRNLEPDSFFTEAASWPSYHLAFPDDSIFEMFRPPVSPELELWFLEYLRIHFPEKDLFEVMAITSDRSLHPLHIAAAIGLPGLCERLAEDDEASVNRLSPVGTPLYCALIGPRVFLEQGDPDSKALDGCPSLAHLETIDTLLDAGASGLNMTRPKFNTTLSVQCIAFRVCEELESADLFRKLYPPAPGSMGIEIDLDFQSLVTDPCHFVTMTPSGRVTRNSHKRLRVSMDLLLAVFDSHIEDCDDSDVGSLLDKIWNLLSFLWLTDGNTNSMLSARMPVQDVDDEEFNRLVRFAISNTQETTVKRLSCDPRFDPNLKMFSSDEDSADNDDPNDTRDPQDRDITILQSVVRDGHSQLASFLLSKGADINARDYMGRTPIILCESTYVLQVLKFAGGRYSDADFAGRTIYHYASACSDCEILTYLSECDSDFAQNLTTRSLEDGRTPAAQAIIYPLINLPTEPRLEKFMRTDMERSLRAAMFLLKHGAAIPGSLHCDNPVNLAKAALRWGHEDLIEAMQECGFRFDQVDEDGNNALHQLTFAATPKLLQLLLKDCATLPMQNKGTRSPTETIFTNTYISVSTTTHTRWTALMARPVPPDFFGALDEEVFEELLLATVASTPEGEKRDLALAICWSDFYQNVILSWLGLQNMEPNKWPLHEALVAATRAFYRLGALEAYKEWKFGAVPAADIANVFCWFQATQSQWWREIILSIFIETICEAELIGEPSTLEPDVLKAFEEMIEWMLNEFNEETENHGLMNILYHYIPIPDKIKDVPTLVAACRSRCVWNIFQAILVNLDDDQGKDVFLAAKKVLRESDLPDLGRRCCLLMAKNLKDIRGTRTEEEAMEWIRNDEVF